MPHVGKKHFSYSKRGRAAARQYAKKTGQRVQSGRKKRY